MAHERSGTPLLRKELSLLNIYALALGATLSSGFFLLPGIAMAQAGPAVILCYVLAALHLVPAILCVAELSTAMPRSGGVYYFLDRSLGPLFGTIGGIGTWLVMILKTAFALLGMGAYLGLFFDNLPTVPMAIALAMLFGFINLFGAKKSGGLQIVMVVVLVGIVLWFSGAGLFKLVPAHFDHFFGVGFDAIYATAGMVIVSFVGLTKIASVSEEVKNPERNLPLGMVLALVSAVIIYLIGTTVMVGLVPANELANNLTPVAAAARYLAGDTGEIILTIAAVLAFFAVSNAAILSASRYPFAMSRDRLLPAFFGVLGKHGTPKNAIFLSVVLIVFFLFAFDPAKIAKLASAFQLLLFGFTCFAVLIMRESRIDSYDPAFRAPFYPWLPIVGILAPVFLIAEMGWLPILFTVALVILGIAWYRYYAQERVARDGAIFHIFARLGLRRFEGLDRELRGILKEKGLRHTDPYEIVIARAAVLDFEGTFKFRDVAFMAAQQLSMRLPISVDSLTEMFMRGTRLGATPVSHNVALPHVRSSRFERQEMVIVRARGGVDIEMNDEISGDETSIERVFALFFMVGPEENPALHLRLLAQLAVQVEDEAFLDRWMAAQGERKLKEIFLRDENFLAIKLSPGTKAGALANRHVSEMEMPNGSLIALIYRGSSMIVPRGKTLLKSGDRLLIIGTPDGISELSTLFLEIPDAEI